MIDTSGGSIKTPTVHVGFYRNGTVAAPTNRGAIVGFNGSGNFVVTNEVAGGAATITTQGSGGVTLRAGTSGNIFLDCGNDIFFQTNNVTRGSMNSSNFLWGKTTSDFAVVGLELRAGGGGEGGLLTTVGGAGSANISCRRIGAASADNQIFINFTNSGGTAIGSIRMDGTTAVELVGTATSDYRVKEELGPIENALRRTLELRPIRYLRTDESDGIEREGLIAHEVAEIVPRAVSGDKDAVNADGTPALQQMYAERLVPLLVGAVQELNGLVVELMAEVRELREDCCGPLPL